MCSSLLALLSTQCARAPVASVREAVTDSPVAIWEPAVTEPAAIARTKIVKELFPRARLIRVEDAEAELKKVDVGTVLIVPEVGSLPVQMWLRLQEYLNTGGRAVLVGCDPFEQRVWSANGRAQTEAELFEDLVKKARAIEGMSTVRSWRHENESGKPRGSVVVAAKETLPWPGVIVEVEGFRDWDALVNPDVPGAEISAHENSLALYARAETATSRLAVICAERDGSHWYSVVPLTQDWRPHVLHEKKFNYFYGGWDRGRPGDHLSLSKLKRMSLGLSMHLGAQPPGRHVFGVSDVRVTSDPRPAELVSGWPDLMLVSPPYRNYEFRPAKIHLSDTREVLNASGTIVQGPLPRARGQGGVAAAPYRWKPIATGVDAEGATLGWPVSIYLERSPAGVVKSWAWIGIDPSPDTRPILGRLLTECVRRLQDGPRLTKAGCDRFGFEQGERILVSAAWTKAQPLQVKVTLADETGKAVAESVAVGQESVRIDLGSAPPVDGHAKDFALRISLEDTEGKGEIYDEIVQEIKVFPPVREPADDDWLKAESGFFRFKNERVFLSGINYWPLSHNGKSPGEFSPHWLEPSVFDPEVIRRDLDRLREVGINAVSIQYHAESQAPQLKFFVEECRRRGIWVHAFVGHLQPLYQDLAKAQRLIEVADLKNNPGLFAIDVAWEPHLGNYAQRCRFDPDWEAWLKEQYGSITHAENVIGRPFLFRDNYVTGPSDENLRTDGGHRVLVAVYRRFVDDYMSRRYGEVARLIRRLGCKQLLSARTGYGGTGNHWADTLIPIDLASGVVHFDFTSPEGYALTGDLDQFYEGCFLTAYSRGVGAGKPVAWLEFGCSVGVDPQPADLENQARLYRNMFELALKSRVAGLFGWWYPSGYRVDERSDMGIVHPDSTWRPVGEAYRELAKRIDNELTEPPAWNGRQVDRFADARGVSGLWDAWREIYREEAKTGQMQEVRPAGFGKLTTEVSLVSVGGVQHKAPAPFEYVNAEWGRIETNGRERPRKPGEKLQVNLGDQLHLELINTGAATWAASQLGQPRTVWVQADHPEQGSTFIEVGTVAFGERARIAWTASQSGSWRIRPVLREVGKFGEPLDVEVRSP